MVGGKRIIECVFIDKKQLQSYFFPFFFFFFFFVGEFKFIRYYYFNFKQKKRTNKKRKTMKKISVVTCQQVNFIIYTLR